MGIMESIQIAFQALQTNKLRSALAILGIVIGVSAVIALMSIGRGAQAAVTSRITDIGTNLLFVRPGAVTQGGVRQAEGSSSTLTLEDAEAIAVTDGTASQLTVAPEVQSFVQAVAGGHNLNTRLMGVTDTYATVRNFAIAEGSFITPQQVEARSLVVVLGANVADQLFPDQSPVGERVRLNQQTLRVIGVLERKGSTGFGSQDDQVMAPITTVQTRLSGRRSTQGGKLVSTINIQVEDAKQMEAAKEEIAALLRQRHHILGEDNFTITSQEDILQTLNQVTQVFTLFLGSIASISLVVGGIGIMNIMLVSVTERTREIGIRKAVGAKRQAILLQFLIEAIVLSGTGGLVGLASGIGIARLVSGMNLGGQVLQTVVSLDIPLLAITVSMAIGMIFGVYPAARAARLDPIEALRYE